MISRRAFLVGSTLSPLLAASGLRANAVRSQAETRALLRARIDVLAQRFPQIPAAKRPPGLMAGLDRLRSIVAKPEGIRFAKLPYGHMQLEALASKPALVVHEELVPRMGEAALEAILAHETVHATPKHVEQVREMQGLFDRFGQQPKLPLEVLRKLDTSASERADLVRYAMLSLGHEYDPWEVEFAELAVQPRAKGVSLSQALRQVAADSNEPKYANSLQGRAAQLDRGFSERELAHFLRQWLFANGWLVSLREGLAICARADPRGAPTFSAWLERLLDEHVPLKLTP